MSVIHGIPPCKAVSIAYRLFYFYYAYTLLLGVITVLLLVTELTTAAITALFCGISLFVVFSCETVPPSKKKNNLNFI